MEVCLAALRHRARELQGQRGHKAQAEPAAQPGLQHSGAGEDSLPLRLNLHEQKLCPKRTRAVCTKETCCAQPGSREQRLCCTLGSVGERRQGAKACCTQALGMAAASHAHQHCAQAEQSPIYSQHQQPHWLLRALKPG